MGIFSWTDSKKKKSEPSDMQSMTFVATRSLPNLNEREVMKIPAVAASVELISNSIAQLPLYLYQETKDGKVLKIADDRRGNLFNHSSNKFDTGSSTKKQIVEDYLLRGRSYLYNNGNEIKVLRANRVIEEVFSEDYIIVGEKKYIYNYWKSVQLDDRQVIEIDSGGQGALMNGEKVLQMALDMQEYSGSLLGNSAMPIGILKTAARLTKPVVDKLRDSWNTLYTGPKKAGKTIILEEGMEFSSLQMSPQDMMINETQKYMTTEIAKLFNIQVSLIDPAGNKYGSLEQNQLQFLTSTVGPILVAIEAALDKYLLTNSEKQDGYYFRFDTSELLRTTETEKVNIIAQQFESGLLSFSESRAKLDLPPSTQEDYFSMSMGKVLYYPDTNKLVNLNILGSSQQTEQGGTSNEDRVKK